MYKIETRDDFQSGLALVVRFPEEDLDHNAMYTILNDKPNFILPFNHRIFDGEVEVTYKIGNMSKFNYLSCERFSDEYVNLWISILQPLFDCDDWFMNPYSFVLEFEHIYCEKNSNELKYIYIPALKKYSSNTDLKNMVVEIAKQNRVLDVNLENKVVWALQDFDPKGFLSTIKSFDFSESKSSEVKIKENIDVKVQSFVSDSQVIKDVKDSKVHDKSIKKDFSNILDTKDFSINISSEERVKTEKKPKKGLFSFKKDKKASKENENKNSKENVKEKISIWGKKVEEKHEIISGAASISKKEESMVMKNQINEYENEDELTELDFNENIGAKLRYIGHDNHPKVIIIDINEKDIFSIGRFDASIGKKQSSFEFDKKTKAISRKHAAIERKEDGYYLIDLSSSAGTYINGKKLSPNTPVKLTIDSRISFGHSGADYLWEG